MAMAITETRVEWEALGEFIAERRKKLRMTQSDLADAICRKQPDVSAFEKAKIQPTIDTFLAICEALDVSPENTLRRFRKK